MADHKHGQILGPPGCQFEDYDVLCPPETRSPESWGCCSRVVATEAEWILATAETERRPVQFRVRKNKFDRTQGMTRWMTGTVASSMLYDGLAAKVVEHDPDERIIWNVRPDAGDEVREMVR